MNNGIMERIKAMNCKEYNEKYAVAYEEQKKDFWSALTSWLEKNPERFIFFRAYIPGFMDGEPCLPCLEMVGAGPGFIGEYYIDSTGDCHYIEDVFHETVISGLSKEDREYLKGKEGWDYQQIALHEDHELVAVLGDGYGKFIDQWDVSGTIKLVWKMPGRGDGASGVIHLGREGYGKPEIKTEDYECGY